MIALTGARGVDAVLRVGRVQADVLYVPQQMALGVLRDRPPEMRTDPEEGDRDLFAGVALDG